MKAYKIHLIRHAMTEENLDGKYIGQDVYKRQILKPVHLLWINLVTDCFPARALSMEKGEKDLMKRPPRKSSDGIFAGGVGFDVVYLSLIHI